MRKGILLPQTGSVHAFVCFYTVETSLLYAWVILWADVCLPCLCIHEHLCVTAWPLPAVRRSSTPTCRAWAASTTGCPSPCPPWTCSALENRCSTKPKRNSTSSSSSTTSAAGECRRRRRRCYLWGWFKLMQASTRVNLSTCPSADHYSLVAASHQLSGENKRQQEAFENLTWSPISGKMFFSL